LQLANLLAEYHCLSDVCLSDVSLPVAYIGPKSRTEKPRKTKIGTEVADVTRDYDITFKVKRSKVNLQGRGHIVAASRTACYGKKGLEGIAATANSNSDTLPKVPMPARPG